MGVGGAGAGGRGDAGYMDPGFNSVKMQQQRKKDRGLIGWSQACGAATAEEQQAVCSCSEE